MADKKSKIGGISKFANFGGGSRTPEGESTKTSEVEDVKTSEIKDSQTSTSAGRKDGETYEHFNGDEPWSKDVETPAPQNAYTSVDTDAEVIEVADITLLGGPGPDGNLKDKDVLTLARHSQLVPKPQDVQASITQRQEDLQTSTPQSLIASTHKDATTSQLQNVSTSMRLSVHEQLSQDEQTSKRTDSQKKKGARSPEKEEGRQTIYFSDPEQRRILQALKFLERRDISEIVSDALDLYVEHSLFKAVLPAVLAAQEGRFTEE